jgi:hypothetical protein
MTALKRPGYFSSMLNPTPDSAGLERFSKKDRARIQGAA